MAQDSNFNEEVSGEAPGGDLPVEPGPEKTPPQAETPEQEAPAPEDETGALKEQLAELNNQYLRKAADFENFRKRMNRDKQEAVDFANQGLLLDLIQVIDDFDRAIKSAETSKDFSSFYEGISMIEKRLSSQLENKWGLKRYDSAGETFDPNRHEAIATEKSPEIEEPTVGEEFLKGYTLKDRVIRTAKVKVLMPDQPEEAQ
ncbi:MAG: nucleotide exchange factor GrpE [Spirochaetaceae bacterium]|jgi:molecular chaperone GrpE|nr:nucleotide exchange factor GrpE [Spirochaetaceae bacterium]